MGRSASPFKGFVHKCDRMQLLQCLRWQVVQSAGDVSDSASVHTAPFVPHLVSVALSSTVPHVQKRKNAKRLSQCSTFASFLNAGFYAVGQHAGDFIVGKTKQSYDAEQLGTVTRCSSLPFTALLLWSSLLASHHSLSPSFMVFLLSFWMHWGLQWV